MKHSEREFSRLLRRSYRKTTHPLHGTYVVFKAQDFYDDDKEYVQEFLDFIYEEEGKLFYAIEHAFLPGVFKLYGTSPEKEIKWLFDESKLTKTENTKGGWMNEF